jgi:hypothetical protein
MTDVGPESTVAGLGEDELAVLRQVGDHWGRALTGRRASLRELPVDPALGMYAACSLVVGAVAGTRAITDFADVWVWVGVAVWSVVFVAMIRRGRALALADSRSSSSRSR